MLALWYNDGQSLGALVVSIAAGDEHENGRFDEHELGSGEEVFSEGKN